MANEQRQHIPSGSGKPPALTPIGQPRGRVTVQTIAELARRIEGLSVPDRAKLCDELAVSQPEALGWVLLLQSQGVSARMLDHVLHLLLVISETIAKTIGQVPRVTLDHLEKADAKMTAMSRLLQGESADEVRRLAHLVADSHPERNLYAYVLGHLDDEAKARERPGDERAIYATEVLLEAFLGASGLAHPA